MMLTTTAHHLHASSGHPTPSRSLSTHLKLLENCQRCFWCPPFAAYGAARFLTVKPKALSFKHAFHGVGVRQKRRRLLTPITALCRIGNNNAGLDKNASAVELGGKALHLRAATRRNSSHDR